MTVLKFPPRGDEADRLERQQMLVSFLEDLLENAKAGTVVGVAATWERDDGSVAWRWPSFGSVHRLGHGIQLLQTHYTQTMLTEYAKD